MTNSISDAFKIFMKEAPAHAKCWAEMVNSLREANSLDKKTTALIYLSNLAVLGQENGIPFHVQAALEAGATKQEIIDAVLIGLPAAGHGVTRVLPAIESVFNQN